MGHFCVEINTFRSGRPSRSGPQTSTGARLATWHAKAGTWPPNRCVHSICIAWFYVKYGKGYEQLQDIEQAARQAGRGLWSMPAEPPQEWRKAK